MIWYHVITRIRNSILAAPVNKKIASLKSRKCLKIILDLSSIILDMVKVKEVELEA